MTAPTTTCLGTPLEDLPQLVFSERCAAQIPCCSARKHVSLAPKAAAGGRASMGLLSAQFATCYKCDKQDKKGNLQRCLGWQLLKRLEDDAATFNAIQVEAAREEGRGGSQSQSTEIPAGGDASAGQEEQAAEPASLTAAVQDAAAAAPAEQELRETKRFELFNRGASLQNVAHCPFQVRKSACAALLADGRLCCSHAAASRL